MCRLPSFLSGVSVTLFLQTVVVYEPADLKRKALSNFKKKKAVEDSVIPKYCGSRDFPVSQSIRVVTKHLVCLDTNMEEGKMIHI